MNGVQLGLFNFASKAKGLQIGLFNYHKEDMKGLQLGLVNANPQTKVQLMVFGGNSTKINVGARFKNKLFYTILGGGTHYLDFDDKFSAALFYRAGLELPLYRNLFVSGDLGYQHIETFRNKRWKAFRHVFMPCRHASTWSIGLRINSVCSSQADMVAAVTITKPGPTTKA